jgi:hypothetical protein
VLQLGLRDARIVVDVVRADQPPHEFDERRLGFHETAAQHVGDDQRPRVDERVARLAALALELFGLL